MNLLPKTNALRKTILLYRFLRYRKGFGVHSPFAYAFITNVIDERCRYYCYDDIELLRKELQQHDVQPVRKEIKRSHGELLFRVANYCKPKRIVQVGSPAGIASLYLTAYASDVKCLVLEKNPEFVQQTRWSAARKKSASVTVRQGDYDKTLPEALKEWGSVDMVFFHAPHDLTQQLVDEALKYVHAGSVFFIEGIRANAEMRRLWKTLCAREQVVLTFDLYNIGIVFFNKRFHKRHYIVFF